MAIVGLPTLIVSARKAWRALRSSRLSRPAAFELPLVYGASAIYDDDESLPDLQVQMVGRNSDINDFLQLVRASPLVFLQGSSGAGKSTFLKLGLGRTMYRLEQWLHAVSSKSPLTALRRTALRSLPRCTTG